jgi:acetylglutamate kinase
MTGTGDRDATLSALSRAMPYVRLYKGRVFVLKIGGALTAEPAVLRHLAEEIAILVEFGIRVVVVHGGGPEATRLASRLGVATTMVAGRRVTDPAALEAVVMALNGTVNTAILAACRAASLSAVGISGVDGGIVRARVRRPIRVEGNPEPVDFGEVGEVVSVDGSALQRLLDAGFVPVVSPVAADDTGRVLNINADTVAAGTAAALGAEKLIFLTETPGILEDKTDPGSLVSVLDLERLASMESDGTVDGGMLPKVNAARAALASGVGRVHMVGAREKGSLLVEVFTNEGAGTMVVRSLVELESAVRGNGDAGGGVNGDVGGGVNGGDGGGVNGGDPGGTTGRGSGGMTGGAPSGIPGAGGNGTGTEISGALK